MRAFLGGARDPRALERSDAELLQTSLAALRPLLGIDGEPLLTRVYRLERGNAQHEVGHLDRMAAIDRALARHPGPVHHRQRLPRRRHSRLRRGRSPDGGKRGVAGSQKLEGEAENSRTFSFHF